SRHRDKAPVPWQPLADKSRCSARRPTTCFVFMSVSPSLDQKSVDGTSGRSEIVNRIAHGVLHNLARFLIKGRYPQDLLRGGAQHINTFRIQYVRTQSAG